MPWGCPGGTLGATQGVPRGYPWDPWGVPGGYWGDPLGVTQDGTLGWCYLLGLLVFVIDLWDPPGDPLGTPGGFRGGPPGFDSGSIHCDYGWILGRFCAVAVAAAALTKHCARS